MLPSLFFFFSIILTYGHCLNEEDQIDTDPTCLLQSYVQPKFSKERSRKEGTVQESSLLSKRQHLAFASLASVATDRKSVSRGMDESSQVMIGLVLVLMVGAIIGLVFAFHHSDLQTKDNALGDSDDDYRPLDSRRSDDVRLDSRRQNSRRRDDSRDLSVMRLNDSLVVPSRREVFYRLPDITQQRKPLEAFSVLDKNGKTVMGVIVKEGVDDPGVLLHGPPSSGGAGAPIAFIATHPEAIRTGQLRIAWPSSEHPRGEMFGTLEPDGDSFKVMREGDLLLWIQGDSQRYVVTTGMHSSGEQVGATAPAGDTVELRLQGGADAALVVLCVLVVMQLSAST